MIIISVQYINKNVNINTFVSGVYVYTGEWLGCVRCERARDLDWSQRSHPLVPVIRGLHLHERPIGMERPIGLCTRLKRVSMESWLVQRPICVWKCDWARPSWDGVATTRDRVATAVRVMYEPAGDWCEHVRSHRVSSIYLQPHKTAPRLTCDICEWLAMEPTFLRPNIRPCCEFIRSPMVAQLLRLFLTVKNTRQTFPTSGEWARVCEIPMASDHDHCDQALKSYRNAVATPV